MSVLIILLEWCIILEMNKIFIFLLVFLFFGVIAYSIMPIIVREYDSGKIVPLKPGEYIDVALNGNPTTGYDWYVYSNITPALKKISGPLFKKWSEREGAGGKVIYRFRAVKKGRVLLKLVYERAWEKVPPIKAFSVVVIVK